MTMTNEQKIKRIKDCMELTAESLTYRDALSHSNYGRGMAKAWYEDESISFFQYCDLTDEFDNIMAVKRQLPMKGDVV